MLIKHDIIGTYKMNNLIYLDNIIFSLQSVGGISIVWYELLKRILEYNVFDVKILDYEEGGNNIFRNKLKIDEKCILNDYRRLPIILERYKKLNIKENHKFIFHSSYYRTCNNKNAINITTVHDFTYEYYRKGLGKFINCKQKHDSIRKSDYIICISQNTKKDLLYFLPDIKEEKIKVVYNGVTDDYFILKESSKDWYFEKYPYALFVGSRVNYKNFELSVKAIAKTNLNLIVVGNKLTDTELVFLKKYLSNRYIHLENITNKKLNELYNSAFCLLYPSSYEGFGIPVIEAQKAGCPVIAYNASSIPEIIGDKSLLINQLSIPEILNKIEKLYNSESRNRIIHNGLINAARFSWDKMFTDIISIYNEAFSQIKNK